MLRVLFCFVSIGALIACPPSHPCSACGQCWEDDAQRKAAGCQESCGGPLPPPSPPSPPSSSKKGVAAVSTNCADFAALGVSSFINWRQTSGCTGWADSIHIPQIWGSSQVGQVPPGSNDWVMGFNEPNFGFSGGGSNIAPADAANLWPTLHSLNSKLVAPAVSTCSHSQQPACNMNGFDWMDAWLAACKKNNKGFCRFEAVGVHSYNCSAKGTLAVIDEAWARYQKPVWLSEFSCAHLNPDGSLRSGTVQENLALAKELLPQLESRQHVARYYWCATTLTQAQQFPFLVNSQLIDGNGDPPVQFTEVGEYFANFSWSHSLSPHAMSVV